MVCGMALFLLCTEGCVDGIVAGAFEQLSLSASWSGVGHHRR
jgi:hypothetical protein